MRERSGNVFTMFALELNIIITFVCMLGKESYLGVFSLSHLRCCIRSGKPLQKSNCLENRIPGTKGIL